MAKSYGKRAKVGILWHIATESFSEVVNLPTSMILARLLTPSDFGLVAATLFFMDLAERMTATGFNAVIVRMKEVTREHLSTMFVITLAIGCLNWILLTLGAPYLGRFFNSPEVASLLPIAAFKFVLGAFGTVPNTILSRDMRFKEKTMTDWAMNATYAVLSVGFAFMGFSYWSIVYANLLKLLVRNALFLHYAGRGYMGWRFSKAALNDLLGMGMGFWAKGVLQYASANLDNIVVGRMLGMSQLGFYDKAFNMAGRISGRLLLAGPSISFRIFALIHEDQERFRRAYRKVLLSVTLIAFPVLVGAIVSAQEFFRVLFGDPWLPSALPFQILCATRVLSMTNAFASSALNAKGWVWADVGRHAVFTVVMVVFVAIGGTFFGLPGAAAGVFVSTVGVWIVFHSLLYRITGLRWRDILAPQVPGAVAALLLLAILLPLRLVLVGDGAPPLQVLVTLTVVGSIGFLVFLRFSRFHEVRALIRETLIDFAPRAVRYFPPLAGETPSTPAGAPGT